MTPAHLTHQDKYEEGVRFWTGNKSSYAHSIDINPNSTSALSGLIYPLLQQIIYR